MRSLRLVLCCTLLAGCGWLASPRVAAPVGSALAATAGPGGPEAGEATNDEPAAGPGEPTAIGFGEPTAAALPGGLLYSRYPGLQVEAELPLIVYLPAGYEWSREKLPAIYLLHGIGYDQRQWVELGAHGLAERQIAGGAWEPLVLIMPLLPDPLLRSSDGGPDSYEAEFLNGLVPFVERNFRTDARRSALAGISRGGVWALEIALRHPDAFAGVAAVSPALHMNFPRQQYDPSLIVAQATRFPAVIYLDAGEQEPRTRAAVLEFSELLDSRGAAHKLNLGEGGHNPAYWRTAALGALNALAEALSPRPSPLRWWPAAD